jgi:hypothetical protein
MGKGAAHDAAGQIEPLAVELDAEGLPGLELGLGLLVLLLLLPLPLTPAGRLTGQLHAQCARLEQLQPCQQQLVRTQQLGQAPQRVPAVRIGQGT